MPLTVMQASSLPPNKIKVLLLVKNQGGSALIEALFVIQYLMVFLGLLLFVLTLYWNHFWSKHCMHEALLCSSAYNLKLEDCKDQAFTQLSSLLITKDSSLQVILDKSNHQTEGVLAWSLSLGQPWPKKYALKFHKKYTFNPQVLY